MPEALPVTAGAALQLVRVDPAAEAAGHVGAGMDDVNHFLPDHERSLFNRTVASRSSNEWRMTMEAITSLGAALALLVLLAVTSMRFGVDSREIFSTDDHDKAPRGSG
jgi:uncharacterized membrane protein YdfJ with MMPL/SSD domain